MTYRGAINNRLSPYGVSYGYGNIDEHRDALKVFDNPASIADFFPYKININFHTNLVLIVLFPANIYLVNMEEKMKRLFILMLIGLLSLPAYAAEKGETYLGPVLGYHFFR